MNTDKTPIVNPNKDNQNKGNNFFQNNQQPQPQPNKQNVSENRGFFNPNTPNAGKEKKTRY